MELTDGKFYEDSSFSIPWELHHWHERYQLKMWVPTLLITLSLRKRS